MNENTDNLLTVKQFVAKYPWPSESALRSYIYRADEFNLQNSFIRVGRRVLVSPKLFFEAIKNKEVQNGPNDF